METRNRIQLSFFSMMPLCVSVDVLLRNRNSGLNMFFDPFTSSWATVARSSWIINVQQTEWINRPRPVNLSDLWSSTGEWIVFRCIHGKSIVCVELLKLWRTSQGQIHILSLGLMCVFKQLKTRDAQLSREWITFKVTQRANKLQLEVKTAEHFSCQQAGSCYGNQVFASFIKCWLQMKPNDSWGSGTVWVFHISFKHKRCFSSKLFSFLFLNVELSSVESFVLLGPDTRDKEGFKCENISWCIFISSLFYFTLGISNKINLKQ